MRKSYPSFPNRLLEGNTNTDECWTTRAYNKPALMKINAELLRICEQQKRLLDEQSRMIVEMLESMGK